MDEEVREQENNEQQLREENEIIQIRREKLASYKSAGCDPFEITKYEASGLSEELKANFDNYEGKTVSEIGRASCRERV